jgi:hypothetical protein
LFHKIRLNGYNWPYIGLYVFQVSICNPYATNNCIDNSTIPLFQDPFTFLKPSTLTPISYFKSFIHVIRTYLSFLVNVLSFRVFLISFLLQSCLTSNHVYSHFKRFFKSSSPIKFSISFLKFYSTQCRDYTYHL